MICCRIRTWELVNLPILWMNPCYCPSVPFCFINPTILVGECLSLLVFIWAASWTLLHLVEKTSVNYLGPNFVHLWSNFTFVLYNLRLNQLYMPKNCLVEPYNNLLVVTLFKDLKRATGFQMLRVKGGFDWSRME